MRQSGGYLSWQLYRRLSGYLKDYWKLFLRAVAAMLAVAVTAPLFAYLIKPLINEGFVEKNMAMMSWLPAAIVGLFVLRGVFNYINEYTTSYLSGHLVRRIRQEMFAKMMRLPTGYFGEASGGRTMSRILGDVGQITEAGFNVVTVLAKDGVSVAGLLFLLLYLDWRLTLITLAALPLVGWCVRVIGRRLRGLSRENQLHMGLMTQILSESIGGMKVVKVYGGQRRETDRFGRVTELVMQNGVSQTAAGSISSAVTQLMIAAALALILYFAAWQAQSKDFSAGDFMSFLSAMLMMFDPIKRITGVMQSLQRGLAAAESVFEFLDEKEEPDEGKSALSADAGDIVWEQVTHRYPHAERDSVKGLNLTVPKGKVAALVGMSGCGKTTLVNMLPRFFDPTEGSVKIGGTDIRQYSLASLREQVALVSQDVVLFNDTVAANIAYGRLDDADEGNIVRAAIAANAWEFIQALPEGLYTHIGENGLKLSGGQRQRIAIARALLKDAPILILDEATSALDNESERLVQAALERLMNRRTTIVIAHRLSTVEKADNIVVMHNGVIVEQGTHKELLAKGGRYADLHRMQFKEDAA